VAALAMLLFAEVKDACTLLSLQIRTTILANREYLIS
jgi:hypothetical protein